MRPTLLLLFVCCVFFPTAPAVVVAEEPPGGSAEEEGLPAPSDAYAQLRRDVSKQPRAQQAGLLAEKARAYLEAFGKSGRTAKGKDLRYLGLLQQTAELWAYALKAYRAVQADGGADTSERDASATAEARLLMNAKARAADGGKEAFAAAIERLHAYTGTMDGEDRAAARDGLRMSIASLLDAAERKQEALDLRLEIVEDAPAMTSRLTRSIVHGLLGRSHAADAGDKVREACKPILAMLEKQQKRALDEAREKAEALRKKLKETDPDALDAGGQLKERDVREMNPAQRALHMADRTVRGQEGALQRLADAGRPFEMLGRPAPAWTLVKAYGDCKAVADLQGKVVMLDFWATWCGWCIKSFPAIRDLLRDYEDKGLAVVGVTASAGIVNEYRYDLDEDMKGKIGDDQGRKVGARLANARSPADGTLYFDAPEYAAQEQVVLATFLKNHEVTWPVVMIDKKEPGPKFALTGWPHAVLLDRQGRVRYFKSGALLRDRPEAVAAFRKVLEDLLAEPAATPR